MDDHRASAVTPMRLLALAAVACGLLLFGAERASAWPGNDKNLCAQAGHPDQVSTVDPIHGRNGRGEEGVWTIRACSPVLSLPKLGVASPTEMYKHVQPDHVMQGGDRAPFISRGRLQKFPYVKGPEGQAVRYQAMLGSDVLIRAIAGAGVGFGSTVVIGVASCLVGLIPTGGVACLAIPAAAIAGIVGAIGGVIEGLIENHLDRVITMGSSDWDFHVPDGWKGWIVWNGFGTIGHDFIDPSFSNLWVGGETPPFRMWGWFSAYPVAQGPNPDARGSKASTPTSRGAGAPISGRDVRPHQLHTLRGEITRRGPDEILQTSDRGRRIQKGKGEDVLFAKGARDLLFGGRGEDVLGAKGARDGLFGGPARDTLVAVGTRDRLHGGRGEDTLAASGRGNRLDGGLGSDTLVSENGSTTVIDTHGNNRINVLNGRPTDTVVCGEGHRDIVIPDRGDRVSRTCKFVFVNGRGAPSSPTQVGERGFTGSLKGTRPIGR